MALLFIISEAFPIEGRGVVLLPGIARDLPIQRGTPIEVRRPDATRLSTRIADIEKSAIPFDGVPITTRGILMPPEVCKEDVPAGSEVWSSYAVDAQQDAPVDGLYVKH